MSVDNDVSVHGVRQDGVVPVCQVRVVGSWVVTDPDWAEVYLYARLSGDEEWMTLVPRGYPIIVARRFSGADGKREQPVLTVVSALRRALSSGGVTVLGLNGCEEHPHVGSGSTEFHFWAVLGSRLTVAVERQQDGSVQFTELR